MDCRLRSSACFLVCSANFSTSNSRAFLPKPANPIAAAIPDVMRKFCFNRQYQFPTTFIQHFMAA